VSGRRTWRRRTSSSSREITERKRTEAALQSALGIASRRGAETAAMLSGAGGVLDKRSFEEAARTIFVPARGSSARVPGYISLSNADGTESEMTYVDSGGLPLHRARRRDDAHSRAAGRGVPVAPAGVRQRVHGGGRGGVLPEGHATIANVLFAPLTGGRARWSACLGLANKAGGFTPEDARMAAAFGEFASVALNNSRNLHSLEASETRFRSVVSTASDAILYIDERGTIVFSNPASAGSRLRAGRGGGAAADHPDARALPRGSRGGLACRDCWPPASPSCCGQDARADRAAKGGTEFPLELSIAAWETEEGCFFTGS